MVWKIFHCMFLVFVLRHLHPFCRTTWGKTGKSSIKSFLDKSEKYIFWIYVEVPFGQKLVPEISIFLRNSKKIFSYHILLVEQWKAKFLHVELKRSNTLISDIAPSEHLFIQSCSEWRRSGVSVVNVEHISHRLSTVSIVDYEEVNVSWALMLRTISWSRYPKNSFIEKAYREVILFPQDKN